MTNITNPQATFTSEQYILYLMATMPVYSIVAVGGLFGNIINIKTYFQLGVNDGVTVCFFLLSISDFTCSLAFLVSRIAQLLVVLEANGVAWFSIDPFIYLIFSSNPIRLCGYMGMFNVTFISVARCLCVAMPLKFKQMFPASRSWAVVITFNILAIISYAVNFANMGVQQRFDDVRNATRLIMWFSAQREEIKDILWLIYELISPLIVESTLILCVVVMTIKLRASIIFRQAQTQSSKSMIKMSSRELRVIYQVILIAVIYIILNVPKIFNAIYSLGHPEFDVFKLDQYLYYFVNDISIACDSINASLNIIVYYNFNAAFRANCFRFKNGKKSKEKR